MSVLKGYDLKPLYVRKNNQLPQNGLCLFGAVVDKLCPTGQMQPVV